LLLATKFVANATKAWGALMLLELQVVL